MGNRSYSIAIVTNGINTIDAAKEKLHLTLKSAFSDYPERNWNKNRIYMEVTNKNIIITNEDLCLGCLVPEITALEWAIFKIFNPKEVFIYFINDSDGKRGFALTEGNSKRLWYEQETREGDVTENTGSLIPEESFVGQLKEDPSEQYKFHHPDYKRAMYGQLDIIENVIRNVLMKRYGFDYEWQEFKGDVSLIDTDDFPIADLALSFD